MRLVVLLRGVNIGGRKVQTSELKACFINAGYKKVATVLATGNVIIESEKTAERLKPHLEKILLEKFNFPIKIGLVTKDELTKILHEYPFEQQENIHRYVLFMDQMIEVNDLQLDSDIEAIKVGKDLIYWKVQKGFTLKSQFAKVSQKRLKNIFSTTRNLNTLQKVLNKMN